MKIVKAIFMATFFLLVSACGGGTFEGDYEGAGGMQEFNFKSDGHLIQSLQGNKVAEYKYEKEGDEIKVYMNENAAQIFTVQKNGELVGPGGVTLTPKK
ncbi:MAG: hypothetical protein KUG72_04010 [Pseudomonadales bacterium]|nr:hypothetical protein [Pseudomonadales bacterium]